jgi:hypothetical protein
VADEGKKGEANQADGCQSCVSIDFHSSIYFLLAKRTGAKKFIELSENPDGKSAEYFAGMG